MAKVVAQKMMYCRNCGQTTLHQKNTKQMSWLMHLVLTVITAGFWAVFWVLSFLWHMIAKPVTAVANRWICSQCGK